jgi:hypothetical protein
VCTESVCGGIDGLIIVDLSNANKNKYPTKGSAMLLLFALFFLTAQSVCAGNITGTVVDSEDTPLEGVTVDAAVTGETVTTDEEGRFEIDTHTGSIFEEESLRPLLSIGSGRLYFSLSKPQNIHLSLISPAGRQKELVSGIFSAGVHGITLEEYATGVYILRGSIGDLRITQK